jgi:hypothetical protein
MAAMGISFVLSGKTGIRLNLQRAAILLLLAYLLNTLKFLLPMAAGAIPQQLLTDFGIAKGPAGAVQLFLLGDILQLAAISLVVLSLLYQLPNYHYWAMALAITILTATPFLWPVQSSVPLLNYFFSLGWGYNASVYFPVFPWLVYPLIGLAAAHYLQTTTNFFAKARNTGLVLMATGWAISTTDPSWHWGDFYRTAPGGTLYYAGFVLAWLYVCHLAVRWLPPNAFFDLLTALSKRITRVYMLQWVLIFWMIAPIGYRQLNLQASLVCITCMTCLVICVSLLPDKIKQVRFMKKHPYETSHP